MCESPPAVGQGTQFYSGSVCESNTPMTSLPHSGFEDRGAHQGHIRFHRYFWTINASRDNSFFMRSLVFCASSRVVKGPKSTVFKDFPPDSLGSTYAL